MPDTQLPFLFLPQPSTPGGMFSVPRMSPQFATVPSSCPVQNSNRIWENKGKKTIPNSRICPHSGKKSRESRKAATQESPQPAPGHLRPSNHVCQTLGLMGLTFQWAGGGEIDNNYDTDNNLQ